MSIKRVVASHQRFGGRQLLEQGVLVHEVGCLDYDVGLEGGEALLESCEEVGLGWGGGYTLVGACCVDHPTLLRHRELSGLRSNSRGRELSGLRSTSRDAVFAAEDVILDKLFQFL